MASLGFGVSRARMGASSVVNESLLHREVWVKT